LDFKCNHPEEWLGNEKSMRSLLKWKYGSEILLFVIVAVAIIFGGFLGFIDHPTVGALLGVAIGYFCADIRKLHGLTNTSSVRINGINKIHHTGRSL